jgi:hypothetical protein
MYYEVSILGVSTTETRETDVRPISSQTEPTYELKLIITACKHECNHSNHTNGSVNKHNGKSSISKMCLHSSHARLYYKKVFSKRIPKVKVLTEYLTEKLSHCRTDTTPIMAAACCCKSLSNGKNKNGKNNSRKNKNLHLSNEQRLVVYQAHLTCNIEWLISVIDTEIDYHLGKKNCTKKYNEKYMNEYIATQLSGFGEKFYHPTDNISNSIIAKIYQLNIKT